MPKTKFGALDIRRLATELDASCVGTRVQNIYDVDAKTFLLKLNEPGREKMLIVIESGVRFHLTKFVKEKSDMPSGFSMKLRKHIRQKRVLSIEQLGGDRVVDFKFGLYEKFESEYHIILELYAAGNVVLTDCNYNVLSLIRVFKDDEVRFAVGENYLEAIGKSQGASLTDAEALASLNRTAMQSFLRGVLADFQASLDAAVAAAAAPEPPASETSTTNRRQQAHKQKVSKAKKTAAPTLKQGLTLRTSPVNHLGPDLVEHCILCAGLQPGQKLTDQLLQDNEDASPLENLVRAFKTDALQVLGQLDQAEAHNAVLVFEKGKTVEDVEDEDAPATALFYDRFDPVLLEQYKERNVQRFDSLNDAVDEFYSKIDIQRQERASIAHKKQAAKKVEAIRKDQESRIQTLKDEVSRKEQCAEAITYNVEDVDKAIIVVRSAVATGMSWEELDELIAAEKAKANPIASLIQDTALERNEITLRLPLPDEDSADDDDEDGSDDDEDDEEADDLERPQRTRRRTRPKRSPFIKVSVNINYSAFANVSSMYQNKKQAVDKAERTKEASEKVLEAAEKKYKKEVEKHEAGRRRVREQRKVNWFEKFRWFITSEGILVLSGRDAQQNELLVKKYLRASHGDIYVHADLHGAATCIARAPKPGVEIPPESLRQAGAMTVCMSNAWSAKIITSAWWVHADQVSKTAPSGEYLSTGSFMIRGKKNFLPPCRLELSFGFIFKLDETQESFETRKLDWRAMASQDDTANLDAAAPPVPPAKSERDAERTEDTVKNEDGTEENDDGDEDEDAEEGEDDGDDDDDEEEEDDDDEDEEEDKDNVEKMNDSKNEDIAAASEQSETDDYDDPDVMDELEAPAKPSKERSPDEQDGANDEATKRGSRYMTAKERRQLKKGNTETPPSSEKQSSDKASKEKSKGTSKPAKNANTELPRRKRGKLKKMKKKYGDQTEEDRRLAMIALGHKGLDDDNGDDEGDSIAESEATSAGPSGPGTTRRQAQTQQKKTKKTVAAGGGDGEDDDELNSDELNLKSFTLNPQPDDVLLYALPMCGPPQATTKFKYRVKVIPGSLKKGKAARMATEVLLRIQGAGDSEKDHIRYVTDNEMVQTMAGNVKLMAPGLAAASGAASKKKGGGKPKKGRVGKPKGGKVKSKKQ
ncbi:Nuclear export mediator factor Nemf [Hondaea fermentalgiana]|uniref:Nuclear export mediator factor Nemf n=1 Tax=Hondaea fermentalgiana TaxID=2315210 RepID=A0A2R5G0G8_9STRA|nr:Nuclear export mediator factor Nemf [Hondaea fermentalgiana]|eukprot:GBG24526.1 Nuclear export mediator factor Nemf [Hondaea fermentalgiana]